MQNGQSFVGVRALQVHQTAAAASNSPRHDQHWVGYSRATSPPAPEYRSRLAYLQETERLARFHSLTHPPPCASFYTFPEAECRPLPVRSRRLRSTACSGKLAPDSSIS